MREISVVLQQLHLYHAEHWKAGTYGGGVKIFVRTWCECEAHIKTPVPSHLEICIIMSIYLYIRKCQDLINKKIVCYNKDRA